MFHLVYWGDLDHNTFSSDPYNPEWVLFAVWEDKANKSSQMYFVADPILVYGLAYKNKVKWHNLMLVINGQVKRFSI